MTVSGLPINVHNFGLPRYSHQDIAARKRVVCSFAYHCGLTRWPCLVSHSMVPRVLTVNHGLWTVIRLSFLLHGEMLRRVSPFVY